jgi:hypothetical protein
MFLAHAIVSRKVVEFEEEPLVDGDPCPIISDVWHDDRPDAGFFFPLVALSISGSTEEDEDEGEGEKTCYRRDAETLSGERRIET